MTDCTGYPSYKKVQQFMFESGFNVPDPTEEPAFPHSSYMKLAARIVDWTLSNLTTQEHCLHPAGTRR